MISLCMIVKPSNDEAKLLDRCLSTIYDKFDEICITITGKNKKCEKVAKQYGAKVSYFKWINDFSAARNFNFKQAKSRYIMWLDCDDMVRGVDKVKGLVEKMEKDKIDACVMNYLYDFDKETKSCTVAHLKTRIVRKDAVKWVGKLHEDFEELRKLNAMKSKDIEVLHITDGKRAEQSAERNLEIAESIFKQKKDARSLFLMGNALMGVRDNKKAIKYFKKFITETGSEEEAYITRLNIAQLLIDEGKLSEALHEALQAFYLRPIYPNALFKLGAIAHKQKRLEQAINMFEIGLQLPVPYDKIIVYNPRDFDLNPMLQMADIYMDMGKYLKALILIKECHKLYPTDNLKGKIKLLNEKVNELLTVDEQVNELKKITDKKELKKALDELPEEIKSHPKISVIRNTHFYKKKSSGRDLAYFCYPTKEVWNPDKQNIGGSEEAVINLSRELAKLGWNVTVYNNCGKEKVYDGVTYKPYWLYNSRDAQDVTILWRSPIMAEYNLNSKKIFVDVHDAIQKGEFTEDRLKNIDGVMFKSQAHYNLFDNVKNAHIVQNGVNRVSSKSSRNPYLILNTSSPDRHLDSTLDVFEEIIKRQPDKPWTLAWFYGWDLFDEWHKNNKQLVNWGVEQKRRFLELAKTGRVFGGYRIDQKEANSWYYQASYYLYPTQFYEIDCISVRKAQMSGCVPITSDFAALKETNKYGVKIHTDGEKWEKDSTFGDGNISKYVDAILNNKVKLTETKRKDILNTYNWTQIAKKWDQILTSNQNKK